MTMSRLGATGATRAATAEAVNAYFASILRNLFSNASVPLGSTADSSRLEPISE